MPVPKIMLLLAIACGALVLVAADSPSGSSATGPSLSPPSTKSAVSVEEALAKRRSVRAFSPDKLDWATLGQLLWSAQGVTEPARGLRTAPSAGATYPLELYVATSEGLFKYDPKRHAVSRVSPGDVRSALAAACLGQSSVKEAPASFIITAVYARTAARYGDRAERYVCMEVGCACENLMLQAAALGLGSVAVGAFEDADVAKVIGCPSDEAPLLVIPVGRPRK